MTSQQNVNIGSLSSGNMHSVQLYESLRIGIERRTDTGGNYFQATLQQRGAVASGGPFRTRNSFRAADVQALRSSYNKQLALLRGLPLNLTIPLDVRSLVQLGRNITEILPQTVRQEIVVAVQRAQRRRRGLRITLEVSPDAFQLLAVPWELMVLPLTRGAQMDIGGEGFLLLNANVTLVRQVRGIGRNTPLSLTHPLKLQAIAAVPEDSEPIETAMIHTAIKQMFPPDMVARCWYNGPGTLVALQERLRESNPQVLLLLCHSKQALTDGGIRSELLFTHSDGYTQRVSAFDLAPVLSLAPDLQLVLLLTGYAGTTDEVEDRAIESIALALVRQGVPAVVAMQGDASQAAVGAFTRTCCTILSRGGSLEQAIAAGRIAVWSMGELVDWSLPVVYQGAGEPDPEIWYRRLADRIDGVLHDTAMYGTLMALALVLLIMGLVRWLLLPSSASLPLDTLLPPLIVWAGLGVVGPAIIAVAYSGIRERTDMSLDARRAALRAQWMGAYLGYALGGLLGMGLLASLWIVGLLTIIPSPGVLLLFYGVLLGALFMSYTIARSQVRSAMAIAPFEPALFSLRTFGLVLFTALVIIAAPFALFYLPETPFIFLLNPAPAAFAMAIALIVLVLQLRK